MREPKRKYYSSSSVWIGMDPFEREKNQTFFKRDDEIEMDKNIKKNI